MFLALAEILAGVTLRVNVNLLVAYTVFITLTPGLMDLRGDVYGALGYRLTKALHLGLAEAKFFTRENAINASIGFAVSSIATITLFTLASLLVYVAGLSSPDPFSLFFIVSASTVIVFVFLTPITLYSIIYLYRHGKDPSPFVASIVTGIGDFSTPLVLVTIAYLHEILPIVVKGVFIAVYLVFTVLTILYVAGNGKLKDLFENAISSIIAATGSSLGGFVLATRVELIEVRPELLAILPAFNAIIGAAMGYLASALNIELHLGVSELHRSPLSSAIQGLLASYVSITAALLVISGFSTLNLLILLVVFLVVSISILIVYTSASVLTITLTILSYRRGWDPDNIVFPIMTTLVDLLGPIVVSSIGLLVFS